MFFALSKLLSFLISPLSWIITGLVFVVISKNGLLRKRLLWIILGLVLFFSNQFIFNECMRLWEIKAMEDKDLKTYEAGIVLGGMSEYDPDLHKVRFQQSVDRLLQAVALYKKGVIKKLIFTGGSGSLLHPERKEAIYLKPYFVLFKVAEKDFLIESESQNTRQNALFSKALIEQHGIKGPLLLITSGFHLRRGTACFKKIGLTDIEPYCTDSYISYKRHFEFEKVFVPDIYTMAHWSTLIHELIGFVVYKIADYA
jgi:uncharacterized SAM-binding protein YcdF (DUF218 family)